MGYFINHIQKYQLQNNPLCQDQNQSLYLQQFRDFLNLESYHFSNLLLQIMNLYFHQTSFNEGILKGEVDELIHYLDLYILLLLFLFLILLLLILVQIHV